jgi:hypothetical protein
MESRLKICGIALSFLGLVPAQVYAATRTEYVTDPTLNNMKAYSITVPSAWHLQGVLLQGAGLGHCLPYPQEVWRATSPDGLSFVEQLPGMSWVYGEGPMASNLPTNGCLPLKKSMNAQDFLKYLASTLQVAYAADEPIPEENAKAQKALQDAEAKSAAQWAALHLQAPKKTVELAQAAVGYKNGSFSMKGRLRVQLTCTSTTRAGMKSRLQGMPDTPPSVLDQCDAISIYYSAPADRFAALIEQWKEPGMGAQTVHEWGDAWVKQSAERAQQQTNALIAASERRFKEQQQEIAHTMAVQQQMHDQFIRTMQEGTDRSIARATEIANSNHRMSQDMVDYSLDRRTVLDSNTGQITKVSNAYSNTWMDATGRATYQTNDPNANPNGVLPGNWTKQTVVRGDGSP